MIVQWNDVRSDPMRTAYYYTYTHNIPRVRTQYSIHCNAMYSNNITVVQLVMITTVDLHR